MSKEIEIQRGDVFATANPWLIGRIILAAQRWLSNDALAEYGHAGIITNKYGRTLESLWTFRAGHLSTYSGRPIMIARPTKTIDGKPITPEAIDRCIKELEAIHLNRSYPWWRLPLHIVPPLARRLSTGHHFVCSEGTAKYEACIGARHGVWASTTPDILADEWYYWKNFDVIYKGIWPS